MVCLPKDGFWVGWVRTYESGDVMAMEVIAKCVVFASILLIQKMLLPGCASDVYNALGPTDSHLPFNLPHSQ